VSKSASYENPHYAVFSKFLSFHFSLLQTFSPAPYSQIDSLLKDRNEVSHSYITTGKIIVYYIFIFTFLDSRRTDEMFWTEKQPELAQCNLLNFLPN
jgi:hypothetical protein